MKACELGRVTLVLNELEAENLKGPHGRLCKELMNKNYDGNLKTNSKARKMMLMQLQNTDLELIVTTLIGEPLKRGYIC